MILDLTEWVYLPLKCRLIQYGSGNLKVLRILIPDSDKIDLRTAPGFSDRNDVSATNQLFLSPLSQLIQIGFSIDS